jgi:hypothetical protein
VAVVIPRLFAMAVDDEFLSDIAVIAIFNVPLGFVS